MATRDEITQWLADGWTVVTDNVWAFVSSDRILNMLATFTVGAAGVFVSQAIVERNRIRALKLKEVRHTNAAIIAASTITNTMLAIKSQHVKALKDKYDADKKRVIDSLSMKPDKPIVIEIQMDLRSLHPVETAIDILKKQLFDEISAVGRPLALVTVLNDTTKSLNTCLITRNEVVATIKASSAQTTDVMKHIYFGIPDAQGHADTTYSDMMDAIANLTDDSIFFSMEIGKELMQHGETLRTELGKKSPKVTTSDFSKAAALLPDPKNYESWTASFKKHPTPESWPERLWYRFMSKRS